MGFALNPTYAEPQNSHPASKKRVWEIFSESGDFSSSHQLGSKCLSRENAPTATKLASGRTVWLSRDPIAENGGINLYAYVLNDPINAWDPFGLKTMRELVADGTLPADEAYDVTSDLHSQADEEYLDRNADEFKRNSEYADLLLPTPGPGKIRAACSVANKATSKIWQALKALRGKTKTNGEKGKKKELYEWDHTHGDIEVYDGRGNHKGTMDPDTGKMIKPPVKGRKIKL